MELVSVSADSADLERIAALAHDIWHEHYRAIISLAQIDYMLNRFQSAAAMREQIKAGYAYYLIKVDQTIAGYLSVFIDQAEHRLFLSKFYLLKAMRGQGLGRQAMTQIEAMAKTKQLSHIYLTVNKANHAAIAAYQNMGFTIVQDILTDIGGGFVMDDYKMLKMC